MSMGCTEKASGIYSRLSARVPNAGHSRRLRLMAALLAIVFSSAAAATPQSCDALFPGGMQSHHKKGQISFGWNAQLLNNPSERLMVAKVKDTWLSLVSSCGSTACVAGGGSAGTMEPEIDAGGSKMDVQVGYRKKATLGADQTAHYRNVTVGAEARLDVSPQLSTYRIKKLHLGYASALNLVPGDYWLEQLTLDSNARINVLGNGTARIFVKNKVTFPWQSSVNMGDGNTPGEAGRLFIYSGGNVKLDGSAQVAAIVYARQQLVLGYDARLYGAASFHNATLDTSARVYYQADAASRGNLTGICGESTPLPDMDGDGIPDEQDIDIDGDGIGNHFEVLAGTDPRDPHNTPVDDDANGVPDVFETHDRSTACRAAFPNAAQTHGEEGSVEFHYDARLIGPRSDVLYTPKVTIKSQSPTPTCGVTQCRALTIPVEALDAGEFRKAKSNQKIVVPWLTSAKLGADGVSEYKEIKVASLATVTLEHETGGYRIGKLSLGYNGVLKLAPGDYWIERLDLDALASVKVVGEGTARLFVKNALRIPFQAMLNADTSDPARLVLYVYDDVTFSTNSETHALVYAHSKASLDYRAHVHGGVTAKSVTLHTGSRITYMPEAATDADFGELCEVSTTPDETPPQLNVIPPPHETQDAAVVLTGTVTEPLPGSGVASVKVLSTHAGEIAAVLSGDSFTAQVPLALGDNALEVIAADRAGNNVSVTVSVRRMSPARIVAVQPPNGSEVAESSVALSGEVHTAWPLSQVSFHVGDTQLPLSESGAGVYRFGTSLTLQVGANTVPLRAVTPDGTETQSLTIVYTPPPDLTPPVLHINNPDGQVVEAASVSITGTVSDPVQHYSGVASVVVRSVHAGEIPATLGAETFTAQIPLALGDNALEIIARDHSGNVSSAGLSVRRISPARFVSVQPPGGSELSEENVTVNGEIHTDWPLEQVRFHLNDAELPLSEAGPGVYRFQTQLTLQVGANTVALRAVTPDGTKIHTVNLVFTPPPDETPPNLHVNNPDGQNVEAPSVLITGTVSDPVQYYSGMDSVTIASDRYAGTSFAAQIQGTAFQAEIPLALEANRLTIVARDLSGNATTVHRLITRTSPLEISGIAPADGSVITSDTTTISGEVRTQHPPEAVRVSLGDWQTTLNGTGTNGVYGFTLQGVPLQLGSNTFLIQVQAPDKTAQHTLTLNHTPEDPESIPAPVLDVIAPVPGSLLSDAAFRLKGRVQSQGGPATVTIDGRPYDGVTASRTDYYFDDLIVFPEGQDSVSVRLQATDTLGKTTVRDLTYHRDSHAPEILLNQSLAVLPAVNPVMESPYRLSGTVVDDNLTSVSLNDQPISVRPGGMAGHYDFTVAVPIPPGTDVPLNFVARDLSGNRSAVEYLLRSEAQAGVTPLLPGEGAQFLSRGEPVAVQVAARLSSASEGMRAVAHVGGQPVTLALSGTLASGELQLPGTAGSYIIVYELYDAAQHLIASVSRQVKVVAEEEVALQLLRHEPENGAGNIEPNQPVELHFNRAIDPALLMVQVRETLHGHTYVNNDPPGVDFLRAAGYQLQEVHRDLEPVPGVVSVLPGNQSAGFYPSRHYGFHADIYVDVNYDGNELGRFLFKVRRLPTFIVGGVKDQFGQPLKGIRVTLAGRTAVTNGDGGFAFGFQEQPGREISGGRHQLVINPEFASPGYGTAVRSVNVQEGRRNELPLLTLTELHPEVPFQLIASGRPDVRLAGDELQLDLSEARLLFANGRTSGEAQVQFFPYEQLGTAVLPGAQPLWAFATQPRGIRVEGKVGIGIQMPALAGGYEYILPDTEYVVLVGFDPEREVISPIGIGRIDNHRVVSVGKVPLQTLDYIGYALVVPSLQPLLGEIAAGTKSLHDLLAALR